MPGKFFLSLFRRQCQLLFQSRIVTVLRQGIHSSIKIAKRGKSEPAALFRVKAAHADALQKAFVAAPAVVLIAGTVFKGTLAVNDLKDVLNRPAVKHRIKTALTDEDLSCLVFQKRSADNHTAFNLIIAVAVRNLSCSGVCTDFAQELRYCLTGTLGKSAVKLSKSLFCLFLILLFFLFLFRQIITAFISSAACLPRCCGAVCFIKILIPSVVAVVDKDSEYVTGTDFFLKGPAFQGNNVCIRIFNGFYDLVVLQQPQSLDISFQKFLARCAAAQNAPDAAEPPTFLACAVLAVILFSRVEQARSEDLNSAVLFVFICGNNRIAY